MTKKDPFDDQFEELAKLFDAQEKKQEFEKVSGPRWTKTIFILLGPAFLISGGLSMNPSSSSLVPFGIMVGAAILIYLKFFKGRTYNPNHEPFEFVQRWQNRDNHSVPPIPPAHPEKTSNSSLSDKETSIWDLIVRDFRKPKE